MDCCKKEKWNIISLLFLFHLRRTILNISCITSNYFFKQNVIFFAVCKYTKKRIYCLLIRGRLSSSLIFTFNLLTLDNEKYK